MFDFSGSTSFGPIAAGSYEAIIKNAEFKKSQNGKNYISFQFLIRDDVEQKFGGRYYFENVWEDDVYRKDNKIIKKTEFEELTPAEQAEVVVTKEYSQYKLGKLVQAQDCDAEIMVDGVKTPNPNFVTKFEDLNEVVQFLNEMPLIIQLSVYYDDKSGEEKNKLEYKGIKRTKHPIADAAEPASTGVDFSTEGVEEIDEDDLPF